MAKSITLTPQATGIIIGSVVLVAALGFGLYLQLVQLKVAPVQPEATKYPTDQVLSELWAPNGILQRVSTLTPVSSSTSSATTVSPDQIGKTDIGQYTP